MQHQWKLFHRISAAKLCKSGLPGKAIFKIRVRIRVCPTICTGCGGLSVHEQLTEKSRFLCELLVNRQAIVLAIKTNQQPFKKKEFYYNYFSYSDSVVFNLKVGRAGAVAGQSLKHTLTQN